MKRIVSVFMISGVASLAHAWTDAGVNYFQPVAAFEALNETDTSSSKNTPKASNHKIQNDFNVVTNIQSPDYLGSNNTMNSENNNVEVFKNIMEKDKLYAELLSINAISPERANAAQFVMLMKEMHAINRNLELILTDMKKQQRIHGNPKIMSKYSDEELSRLLKEGFKNGFKDTVSYNEQLKKEINRLEQASKRGGNMSE